MNCAPLSTRRQYFDPAEDHSGMAGDHRRRLHPAGRCLTLRIDNGYRFRMLTEGECWIAVGALETVVLALTARAWSTEDVSLEVIRDLAAYEGAAEDG
jgi:hypothetical protein